MGFYNDIALQFDHAPDRFKPTFYESKVGAKRIQVVDEWCMGFLKGMRLDAVAWIPLRQQRPDLLKSLLLFGTRAGWSELKAGDEEKMHGRWRKKIAPAVRQIHAFWAPHRRVHQMQLRELHEGEKIH
jgi:uncharacterized protein